jgi:hypothetical protein
MTQYTITLTQAEDIALQVAAVSPSEWIDNVVHERCRISIDNIVKICVDKCLENNIQIPGSKDAMVMLAVEQEWVKPLEQVQQEMQENSPDTLE